MRVLVVTPQPPSTEGGAADRCTVGLVRGLLHHGMEVTVLAAHLPFTPDYPRPELPALEVINVATTGGWRGRLDSLVRPVSDLADGQFATRVRELAVDADIVHLEQVEVARALHGPTPPSVAHVHYRAHLDRPYGKPWRRQFRQVLEFTRAERAAARQHRWLVASSPVVAASLQRLAPRAEVVIAPLSVDPSAYPPGALPATPTAGLIGNTRWGPTGSSFDRLESHVWPLVASRVPEGELHLAGRGIGEPRRMRRNVIVEGEVDDSIAFLRRLSVLVFPITRGSGMKVKTLEALAMGIPVVTTPEGAEGMPASDGVLVATSDDEVADHTARLLADRGELEQRAAAARKTFDDHLSPPRATEPLVDLYRRINSA